MLQGSLFSKNDEPKAETQSSEKVKTTSRPFSLQVCTHLALIIIIQNYLFYFFLLKVIQKISLPLPIYKND